MYQQIKIHHLFMKKTKEDKIVKTIIWVRKKASKENTQIIKNIKGAFQLIEDAKKIKLGVE